MINTHDSLEKREGDRGREEGREDKGEIRRTYAIVFAKPAKQSSCPQASILSIPSKKRIPSIKSKISITSIPSV